MKRTKPVCTQCGNEMKQMSGPKLRKKTGVVKIYYTCDFCGNRHIDVKSAILHRRSYTYAITISDDTGRLEEIINKALIEFYKESRRWAVDDPLLNNLPRKKDWSVLDELPDGINMNMINDIVMMSVQDAMDIADLNEFIFRASIKAKRTPK